MRRTISTLAISATVLLSTTSVTAAQEASPGADGSPMPVSDGVLRLGSEVGPLEPGTYADVSLGPEVRFSVGDGWQMSGEPIEGVGVQLGQEGIDEAAVTITAFPGTVPAQPCIPDEDAEAFFADTRTIEASARSFYDHLAANPYLAVEEPLEVEIDGWPGLQFDLTSSVPPTECQPPLTVLWTLPVVDSFYLLDQESARAVALDVADEVIVVFIEANPGVDWPAFLEASMPLVESLSISTPDAPSSPEAAESGSTAPASPEASA